MFSNNENLEYVLAHSNPHSSVRVELETEIRARKHLSSEVQSVKELNGKSAVSILWCRDIYHVVSDDYYLRSRDHLYIGDRSKNNRTFRGNVKVPLVLPGSTPQNTPHMIEFTWDYSLEEFEEIAGRLKTVTVIEGLRKSLHSYYVTPSGHMESLVLAFDSLSTFDGAYSQFTELSVDTKISDGIPFSEFEEVIRDVDAGGKDSELHLDFLSSCGLQKNFIKDKLYMANVKVHTFMKEMGVDYGLLENRIYPRISLDLHGNDFDKTRRLDYH